VKRANLDELRAKEVRDGVTRRVFSGERVTLAWHTLEPGHHPEPHSHPHEQVNYVLAGRIRFSVGDEQTDLGPGGVLVVPPGVEHDAETLGDEPALVLNIFGPKREDYAAEE
jgi:quercetin dioxygenase-like cupin family protein